MFYTVKNSLESNWPQRTPMRTSCVQDSENISSCEFHVFPVVPNKLGKVVKYEAKIIMSIIYLETLNNEWGQIDPKGNRRVKSSTLFLQHVTCGTWAPWSWSLWRGIRRFRRRPRWPSPWTPHRRPPPSTSRCRHRASRSLTTRGSECTHVHPRSKQRYRSKSTCPHTLCLLPQVVFQETLRSQHGHLLFPGPTGQEVSIQCCRNSCKHWNNKLHSPLKMSFTGKDNLND